MGAESEFRGAQRDGGTGGGVGGGLNLDGEKVAGCGLGF